MRIPWRVPVKGDSFQPIGPLTDGSGLNTGNAQHVSRDDAREGSHGRRTDKSDPLVPTNQGSRGAWLARMAWHELPFVIWCHELRSGLQFPEEVGLSP